MPGARSKTGRTTPYLSNNRTWRVTDQRAAIARCLVTVLTVGKIPENGDGDFRVGILCFRTTGNSKDKKAPNYMHFL